ncbi:MAG: FAD-dependent oxidoreductase [Thermoplasmata archaeon]|nr:MAG: FAD-dependent oxidoreductase [Thermoplasmata archaeon]
MTVGIFLCDCGTNIRDAVDLDAVEEVVGAANDVRVFRHTFLCSEDGQDQLRRSLDSGDVDRVVVAACSPRHHGEVFRQAVEGHGHGLEPVMANIREQCAWVTPSRQYATDKAVALVLAAVAKARSDEVLGTISVPVRPEVVVVGGGIAGMHAALELADRGVTVHLVEREATPGGTMLLLNRTFPTDDCSTCSIAPVLSDLANAKGVQLHTLTDVVALKGRPGAWRLTMRTRPRHVSSGTCTACGDCTATEWTAPAPLLGNGGRRLIDRIAIDDDACTSCGSCVKVCEAATGGEAALTLPEGCEGAAELEYDTSRCVGCWRCLETCPEDALRRVAVCPVVVPSEMDQGLGWRHAIHLPNPHAVPLTYVRDPETCLALTGELPCVGCSEVCPADAVVDGEDTEWELEASAIVLATGVEEADLSQTEYRAEHPDVITALQLERLLAPDGPTDGQLLRPSDGERPSRVVFVQCAGSRSQVHNPHCSRVCCSHAVKNASLIRRTWDDVKVTVCYTDIRLSGRDAEEYYDRAREAEVRFLRGSVAEIDVAGERPVVVTEDTLGETDGPVELEADLVVLSTALVPSRGTRDLVEIMPLATDPQGFLRPVHPKLRPVDMATRGIHVAGSVEFPKFVQDCIVEGGAAAQRAANLATSGQLDLPRTYPRVDEDRCIGCMACVEECPFEAIEPTKDGRVRIVEAACRPCGKCVAACLSTALDLRELPLPRLRAQVDEMLGWASQRSGGHLDRPVVAYSCNSCGYNAADLAGSRRMEVPVQVLPVWVPCSGRLSVEDLVHPFTRGAAGVMVMACLPDQCTFVDGNTALAGRLEQARRLLTMMDIDPERLRLVHTSSADAALFVQASQEMSWVAQKAQWGDGR